MIVYKYIISFELKYLRMRIKILLVFLVLSLSNVFSRGKVLNLKEFYYPSIEWRPIPLWFWNNTEIKEDSVVLQLEKMLTIDNYGGCAILPFGPYFKPIYLSKEYFDLYGKAIDTARKYGAKMSLYDEYGFPSGSMGAINASGISLFKNNHPGKTIKRLDLTEYMTTSNSSFECRINPNGVLMSAVAMEVLSKKIISLRNFIDNGSLYWKVPKDGVWKVMLFSCVEDGDPNVDYLSPEAVKLFIKDTHEYYYKYFAEAFRSVISTTFFDEPTMYRANGRMWTDDYNEKFIEYFGFSPEIYYPALWYDIGPKTGAIRNSLFGMRAMLYAEGFMKTISDWANEHGIVSTGHQDQEEILNPVSISGDLMLDGKYMGMPGIDKIGGGRPTENFYKIVSSSANNWDKPIVMSETYGAMGNISIDEMYRIAIEQYTKGINNLIPHAVWYDNTNVSFLPELSYRNPLYRKVIPDFNKFLSRLNYVLARSGRHVADVAIVYPINTLQAGHFLDGPKGFYDGGTDIPGTDYNLISEILTDKLGIDFTFIHPEVLDDRCVVENKRMKMKNIVNTEFFSVIILPGCRFISLSNMKKIEKAWENGVTVIFTTQLPSQTTDIKGEDSNIKEIVNRMLVSHKEKGKAFFVERPDTQTLSEVLENLDLDVKFEGTEQPFNYIHKVISGGNVYYFGNIDKKTATNRITLMEKLRDCYLLDPKTGKSQLAHVHHKDGKTVITLTLAPGQSILLVESNILDVKLNNIEDKN